MLIEEKARAYDRVSKEVKDFFEGRQKMYSDVSQTLEYLFPELKEPEDEKIRKTIIRFFKDQYSNETEMYDGSVTVGKAIAWLEKQGEQKNKINSCKFTCEDILALECSMKTAKITKGGDELYKILVPLYNKIHNAYLDELQGEQKPVDKVELKFKVGDWIANDYCVGKVMALTDDAYLLDSEQGIPFSYEHNAHLWTIQDANDGDVLVASDGSIFLFAGVVDCACKYYVALTTDNYIKINKEEKGGYWETSRAVYPATKEQRDLLFSKMKKAGYEWDADKKELSKRVIDEGKAEMDYCFTKMMNGEKVSPTWSEEDEDAIEMAIIALEDMYDEDEPNTTYGGYNLPFNKAAERLKSFKERILPQSKQEWSEDDERMLEEVKFNFAYNKDKMTDSLITQYNRFFDKIKSLKPQPKQEWSEEDERLCSCIIEEQEESLDNVKNDKYGHSEIISDLKEMYRERIDWLKSLRQRIGG